MTIEQATELRAKLRRSPKYNRRFTFGDIVVYRGRAHIEAVRRRDGRPFLVTQDHLIESGREGGERSADHRRGEHEDQATRV